MEIFKLEEDWSVLSFRHQLLLKIQNVSEAKGDRNGAVVVRALASDQCDLGSISRLGVTFRLILLVLYSAPRGFSPITPVFRSRRLKNQPTILYELIWFCSVTN